MARLLRRTFGIDPAKTNRFTRYKEVNPDKLAARVIQLTGADITLDQLFDRIRLKKDSDSGIFKTSSGPIGNKDEAKLDLLLNIIRVRGSFHQVLAGSVFTHTNRLLFEMP